jgi:IclR family mhp operon transcriptional activator
MGSFPPVHSVVRAIDLLQALNRQPVSTIDNLHLQTRIPKPSIIRLLQTFMTKGLVRHAPQHGAYYLTSQVRSLAVGYHSEPKIVEAAAPLLDAMTRQVKWPMAIAIPDYHAVFIRYSTVPISPFSLHHSSINMRLSFVSRALGRAFLAFCEPDEQDVILKSLSASTEPEDEPAQNAQAVRLMLAKVRARGYATRDPKVRPISNTLALPVYDQSRVVASVGLTFFSSTLKLEQAVKDHLGQLQDLTGEISARLAGIQDGTETATEQRPSIRADASQAGLTRHPS